MARDRESMTEDDFEALKESMDDRRDKLRETLAVDSGDEPDEWSGGSDGERSSEDGEGEQSAGDGDDRLSGRNGWQATDSEGTQSVAAAGDQPTQDDDE